MRNHRHPSSAIGLTALLLFSGCATRVEQATIRINESLATTFRLTLTTPPPPRTTGILNGVVGLAVESAIAGVEPPAVAASAARRPSSLQERATACGASYSSIVKRDGTTIVEVEREYRTPADLDRGLRCASEAAPPKYSMIQSEGFLSKTITLRFDYPINFSAFSLHRFPDEVIISLPWKIVEIDDSTQSVVGKLKLTQNGENEVRARFVKTAEGKEYGLLDPTTVRLQLTARQWKFELATILTAIGLLFSMATLVFGSGVAKRWLEARREPPQ